MNRELLMLVEAISREKNVERDVVLGAVEAALAQALDLAMHIKPERHHFTIDRAGEAPHLPRHMSMTGG